VKRYSSTDKQQGIGLIEAIITVVLVAILTKGAIYVTARASALQSKSRIQEIAITQLRDNLTNGENVCTTAPEITLPNNEVVTAQVQGCSYTTTATINGVVIANVPVPISLSIDSLSMGGQVVVGGTWVE